MNEPAERGEKPFMEHLEDLRRTLIGIAVALAAGMGLAVPIAPQVLGLIKVPLARHVPDVERFLQPLDISGGFSAAMTVIFWTGLLFSFPFVVAIAGRFVFPGLTLKEKRSVTAAMLVSGVLFAFGALLGYRITLPTALGVMLDVSAWMGFRQEFAGIGSVIRFSLQLVIASGLAFELPVVLLLLGHLGIVDSRQLREKRRLVIVLLAVVAAVLTPPDIFSQMMMGIPLVLLYEGTIWILWARERRKTP